MDALNKACAVTSAVEHGVAAAMEKWGRLVARHPAKVFAGSLVFALLCISGVAQIRSETETENLWTPIGAPVIKDKDLYSEMFGSGFRIHTIFFKDKKDGNVLTLDHFKEVYEFDTKIRRDMTVCVDDVSYNFTALCARARPTDAFCLAGGSPLEFMYNIKTHRFDFDNIKTDAQLLAAINDAKIRFTPDGSNKEYELDISDRYKLMSKVTYDDTNKLITGAKTLKMTWFGSRDNDTNTNDDRCYDCNTGKGSKGCNPSLVWELKFVEEAEKFGKASKFVAVHVQAESSVSMALGSVILGDVAKLNVSFFVIILYSILVLGKLSRCGTCAVLSRTSVAFAGVVSVGLSIGGCYGLNGYFGVPLTPVTNVLPFILIGIGVDDMFVLAGALDRAPRHLDLEDRLAFMMKTAGTSITLTSVTDCVAFALGTTTSFPALKYFCIYASIGIVLDFWFQISVFVACLVWDEQRIMAKERDCFCCVMCCAKRDGCCKCCFAEDEKQDLCCDQEGGHLRNFVRKYYAPLVCQNLIAKVVIIATFLGFFGFGISVVPKLSENFSLRFFVPTNHPLTKTFDIADNEFNNKNGISVDVMMDHRKSNNVESPASLAYLHADAVRTQIPKAEKALGQFEWTLPDSLSSPLKNLTRYIAEAEDGFPLSPRMFSVPGTPTTAKLLERNRSFYTPAGPHPTMLVYPNTVAEDCSPTGAGMAYCPATEGDKQGAISKGVWPKLKTSDHIENLDKIAEGEAVKFKDPKMFYDVLHHWITTPQGAGMRGYLSLHPWYQNFTEWIEWLPEKEHDFGDFKLDKRRDMRGLPNDVHNGTRRPLTAEKFCSALKYFLKTTDSAKVHHFNNGTFDQPSLDATDPKCYPTEGDIQFSRINAEMKCKMNLEETCENANSTQEVLVMDGIRKKIADLKLPLKPIPYSFTWLFTEQYSVVRQEAYMNISLAIVAVFAITVFFLCHIWCAILVTINVGMVLIDVVALMYLWKLSINSVSIINLVLAVGLAVDYSAHVAHAFMSATGTGNERATKALTDMGSDVIHGAMSTFLAVLVLSTSKSYIFVAMFQQFFGICVFGALHGLLLLPVVLSLVGPPTTKEEESWSQRPRSPKVSGGNGHDIEDGPHKPPVAVSSMQDEGPSSRDAAPVVVDLPNLDIGPTDQTSGSKFGSSAA